MGLPRPPGGPIANQFQQPEQAKLSRRRAGQQGRGRLDGGGDVDEGGSARHRTEAEADRWVDHVEPAQLAAGNARVGCGFITWSLAKNPALLDQVLDREPAALMLLCLVNSGSHGPAASGEGPGDHP